MVAKKDFFSFEFCVIFMVAAMVFVTVCIIVKSAVDDANTLKVDGEIKRTYLQWAKDHGQQGRDSVDEYLKCLKFNGDEREVGNWLPDKKDCLLLNKDKDFVQQVVTNIKSLDVPNKNKMDAIGEM